MPHFKVKPLFLASRRARQFARITGTPRDPAAGAVSGPRAASKPPHEEQHQRAGQRATAPSDAKPDDCAVAAPTSTPVATESNEVDRATAGNADGQMAGRARRVRRSLLTTRILALLFLGFAMGLATFAAFQRSNGGHLSSAVLVLAFFAVAFAILTFSSSFNGPLSGPAAIVLLAVAWVLLGVALYSLPRPQHPWNVTEDRLGMWFVIPGGILLAGAFVFAGFFKPDD